MTSASQAPADFVHRLRALRRPVLFSHHKPDGDALGALAGLKELLAAAGAAPQPYLYEPLPPRYRVLPNFADVPVWNSGGVLPAHCDGIVIVDTCAWSQVEPIAPLLRGATVPRLVIDHHQTRDPLADGYWIDVSAAATCLMIFELARDASWTITPAAAEALFIGVATDTGWFRHSNTDARVHRAAAELHARGVRADTLFDRLYQREQPGRIRLLGEALASLTLSAGDRLAVMTLDAAAFARSGATPSDTEDMVNEPLRIATVVLSVLLVQQPDGLVRANFRSKVPHDAGDPDIDVATAARHFGGGGHTRAAGARFSLPLNEAQRIVREYLERELSEPRN